MQTYAEKRIAEITALQHPIKPRPIDADAPAPKPTGWVYFLRADNAVKIGFSINPRDRLATLKTASPGIARIVKLVKGTMKTERDFHKRFAEYRTAGEWFELRGNLARYLERCLQQIEMPPPMPPPAEPDFRL